MPRHQQQDTLLLVVVATAVLLGLACFLLLFVRAYLRNRQRLIHENAAQAERHRHALLETRLEIQEETVRHIGRELHDNIGQIASLMKANLAVLQIKHPGPVAADLEETMNLLRALIGDVREMSVSLSGADLKNNDLTAALQHLATATNRISGRQVSFVHHGPKPGLTHAQATILYRIVQEALSNAVKHSRATDITLTMEQHTDGRLLLAVADNGTGLGEAAAAQSAGGNGLRNMKERAALLHAGLSIATDGAQGTTIRITLPNPAPNGAASNA